ncbi:hypothetical protein AB0F95_30100, partial [Micromonospora tulbaghiae]|uniref:hypothetical protein n=1 Tax=Micromonospora tulbaghiae TaxID=479978 RepID=UPI0033F94928
MADSRPRVSLLRFGAPGPYVLSMVFTGLAWLPIRLWEERDGSVQIAVLRAGLAAVIWGFVFFFLVARGKPRPAEADRAAAWAVTETALRRGRLIVVGERLPADCGLQRDHRHGVP